MPRPPGIADLFARDNTPFAVVAVERTTGVDLPARFTARVRTADYAPLGAFDAVREVDGPEGTWIVTALDGDVRVLREGGAVVLAGPDGLELHGRVTAVIASGAP